MNVLQASRQASTRAWWDGGCSGFDLFTSREVIEEVSIGEEKMATERLELLKSAKRLEITDGVGIVAEDLIKKGLIPIKAASDAIHIGVASVHEIDYLVTWNFKHIANPFTRDRLRKAVEALGFRLPMMCSPDELLQYDEDS